MEILKNKQLQQEQVIFQPDKSCVWFYSYLYFWQDFKVSCAFCISSCLLLILSQQVYAFLFLRTYEREMVVFELCKTWRLQNFIYLQ